METQNKHWVIKSLRDYGLFTTIFVICIYILLYVILVFPIHLDNLKERFNAFKRIVLKRAGNN